MGTTKEDIAGWFDRGVAQGAEFMVVLCDTFDHEDYPSYVKPGESVQDKIAECRREEGTRVMEVYSLKSSKKVQLAENRAFHLEHFDAEAIERVAKKAMHLARHVELHKALDELVACYKLAHPHKLLQDTNLLELIEWSFKATKEVLCKP